MKFMNRAGGFLESISIVLPELGGELIDEFEAFAARIDGLSATDRSGERRMAESRRAPSDRRARERRFGRERRHQSIAVALDLRRGAERRIDRDRRTGAMRELADRRLRALHS
ncbi:MAG: hypothetical protein M3Z98_01195 [Candidatus Dormibacteraeota bacterium]|nr:hypothetical protein [Candidatus Dormibacteraeota bacterium]